jgi:hypothetical protein
MTAGYGLAGAPSSGMIHAAAQGVYREVTAGDNVYCSASYQGAFERLERSDAKVSRAVLRGPGGSNAPWLPDQRFLSTMMIRRRHGYKRSSE